MKMIPGVCTIDISLADKEMENRLDPALNRVKPNEVKSQNFIREVREFRQEGFEKHPHLSYVNELFIYPESVNFSNYHNGSVSCRNICVEVRLMENDFNVNSDGQRIIFGKSTSSAMTTRDQTCVFYHNKKPKFYDEIKIQLPFKLTPNHHLLIIFYHIQCQLKKPKKEEKVDVS